MNNNRIQREDFSFYSPRRLSTYICVHLKSRRDNGKALTSITFARLEPIRKNVFNVSFVYIYIFCIYIYTLET